MLEGVPFSISLASAALAGFLWFFVLYIISLARRDNRIADIGWPIAFIIAVVVVLFQRESVGARNIIVTTLVMVWGVRLALHVWLRSRGKGEDWWHKELRRAWGEHWVIRSFLQLYLLQAAYVIIIVSPALYVNTFSVPSLGVLDFVGLALWVIGFLWEAVGDHQLVRFKQSPKNKGHVLRYGLWRYSRHPNYFGEVLMWFGIWLMAMSIPGSLYTVSGPLFILALLVWIRGVPSLERHLSANPEYLAYQRKTNMLVPWFPHSK